MRDRMALPHSVCHHHEFVKTSHRGSHETCSTQVLTEPSTAGEFKSRRLGGGRGAVMPRVPFALVLQVSDTYLPTVHHLINGNYPGLDLRPRMDGAYSSLLRPS